MAPAQHRQCDTPWSIVTVLHDDDDNSFVASHFLLRLVIVSFHLLIKVLRKGSVNTNTEILYSLAESVVLTSKGIADCKTVCRLVHQDKNTS